MAARLGRLFLAAVTAVAGRGVLLFFAHDEALVELAHFFDNTAVFEFGVGQHRGTGEALVANLGGLLRDVVTDPIPEWMIERIDGFGELAVVDAEGGGADDRG